MSSQKKKVLEELRKSLRGKDWGNNLNKTSPEGDNIEEASKDKEEIGKVITPPKQANISYSPGNDELDLEDIDEEETSLISRELKRFDKQINELQDAIDDIDLSKITDIEEKAKIAKIKAELMLKMPALLIALDDLKTKNKKDIKGGNTLSPLESGLLDD